MKKFAALALSALIFASPAHAKWLVSESEHFRIYSEEDEASLRTTATQLETYDHLLRAFTNNTKPSSPIKINLYRVRDLDSVRATLPYETYGIGGFYWSTPRGPYLIATRRGVVPASTIKTAVDTSRGWAIGVTQHEYTHHYMYQYFPGLYPTWYSEGFAEFYGSMDFKPDNVVELGNAPMYRMDVIRSSWYPMRKLLTAKSYDDVGDSIGSLYAQGWLLTHYCAQNPKRGVQLNAYLKAIGQGATYADAAKAAFGDDLDKLDDEMKAHAKNLSARRLALKPMDLGKIEIRALSDAESDLVKYDMRMYPGYKRADLPQIVKTAEASLAKEPNNLNALSIVAELNQMANFDTQATALADRMIAIDPNNAKAYFFKGQAAVKSLDAAKSTDSAAWESARNLLRKSNKLNPNYPASLEAYYDSYTKQGISLPPEDAQNGLMNAHMLVPSEQDITYKLAADFERRGYIDDAIYMISPLAFGTKDSDDNEKAREKNKKDMERNADKYTGIVVHEEAKVMLKRLQEKKKAMDGDKKTVASPASDKSKT